MVKRIFLGLLLSGVLQLSAAKEMRHGISFELPKGFKEITPCELPKPNSKIIPITAFEHPENARIKLYILKNKGLPRNQVILRNLEERYKNKYKSVVRDGKSFGEYMSYFEARDSYSEHPDIASYLLRAREGWRVMIETEYTHKTERESINNFLNSLKISTEFPLASSSNQNFIKWSKKSSEFAPFCRGNIGKPRRFFYKPIVYPMKAHIRGIEAKLIAKVDIDSRGYLSGFELEGENADYFREAINEHLKSTRFQIKLNDGKPTEQRGVEWAFEFEVNQ